jgi:transposase
MVSVGLTTQPEINLMRDVLLDADLIYCDETTFQIQRDKGLCPSSSAKGLFSLITPAQSFG